MENLKKIILSLKSKDEINRMIIVGEDKIERYSNRNLSNDELRGIYTKYVNILKNDYKSEIEGLNDQEVANKLAYLEIIVRNEDNLIVNITESDDPKKFVITYENGKQEEKKYEDNDEEYNKEYQNTIENICKTYYIPMTNLTENINRLKKIGLYSNSEETKDLFFDDKPEYDDNYDDYEEDFKIRNFIVNHPFISGLIGAGIIGVLVHAGIETAKNNAKYEENKKTTIELELPKETEKPEFEFIVEEEIPEPTMKIVYEPTVIPTKTVETYPEIQILNEEFLFKGYEEPSSNKVITKKINGEEYVEFNPNLESLIETRNYNMDSIANKIQSDIDLQNDGLYIYFENLFNDYDVEDKAFVKYFSMLGNQIIKCAYKDDNFNVNHGVIKYSKESCYKFIRYVRDNEPLPVCINGQRKDIYYSNLSHDAKEAVINIAWANYTPLNSYPEEYKDDKRREESLITEFDYNNEHISKADVADIIVTAYESLNKTK